MSTLTRISKKPSLTAYVELFRLDTSLVGGSIHYFCQGKLGSEPVTFGGLAYTPIDIQFSDFEVVAGGSLPTPKMKLAITSDIMQAMINAWGDLAGCEIRRVRTFQECLDGQPEADAGAYLGPDVFRIERLSEEVSGVSAEWELSAAIDQEGRMLPGRQVLRDVCSMRYRRYDPSHPLAALDGYVYPTINPCPYTGVAAFDDLGQSTSAANDKCSHQLNSGCRKRFDNAQPLPFGGFPGVARVRL
jgi:lambda family phage minor tail protein L